QWAQRHVSGIGVGTHHTAFRLTDEVVVCDPAPVRMEGTTLPQCDGVHPALGVGQLHGVTVGERATAAMDTGQRRSRSPASCGQSNRPGYRSPTAPRASGKRNVEQHKVRRCRACGTFSQPPHEEHGRPRPMSQLSTGLGIDIGGTGIKGAPVDLRTGEFLAERRKLPTPEHSDPATVARSVEKIVTHFPEAAGAPLGITFPGVVHDGVVHTAANLHKSWVGTDATALFSEVLGRPVRVLNDADAAALAEVRYGAAQDTSGVVLLTTLGTGIGTALIVDGHLVPNTEFGHLEIDGYDA